MKTLRFKQAHNSLLLIAVVMLCASATEAKVARLAAQTTIDFTVAQFEVASVRPNRSAAGGPFVIVGLSNLAPPAGGRFTATNVTVQLLIENVYGVSSIRVVGSPAWLTSERFDIAAKAPERASPATVRTMVRGLLADRFRLKVHIEQRENPVYMLTKARRDGRLGPKLRQSDPDCVAAANSPSLSAPHIPDPSAPVRCGGGGGRPGFMRGRGIPLSYLASALTRSVGRVVIDQTDLAGAFDYELQWTPEQASAGTDTQTMGGVSVFTALQEQLGLKLDSGRAPVEVLVIDSVEKPSPN